MINFNKMNINSEIKLALKDMGFSEPTPIQQEVIPLILNNHDVIAQAPTGTGKTCAFGIPAINNINTASDNIQVLILCPTRELVIQTENELKKVAKHSEGIRIVSIYGGQNIERQLAGIRRKPQIIIGTTGRVMDHLRRKTLKISDIQLLILDEMDEMLNMGFKEDIDVILETVPKARQTVFFSATMPKEIVAISKCYQNDPITIKTQNKESDIPNINQYYVKVKDSEKPAMLMSIMHEKKFYLALVFCRTKKRADELCEFLKHNGFKADALHSDLRQKERDKTMKKFRSGDTQMLIATDVAARGIDVDNLEAVFNFDIPQDEEYYVHRIGRTARANRTGSAYTFVSDKQMQAIKNFERYTKNTIIKAEFPEETAIGENDMDKLFSKTLKLMKREELKTYREFITSELKKNKDVEVLDFAAALLMQLNELQSSKDTSFPNLMKDESREFNRKSMKSNEGTKFFMNIGFRDKCDSKSITSLITSKTNISAEDVLDVSCLDNFSFVIIKNGCEKGIETLNGLEINNRVLSVEISGNKEKKSFSAGGTGRKPFGSGSRDRKFATERGRDRKPFGDERSRNRKSSDVEANGDRKPFATERTGKRKTFGTDSGERKPFGSTGAKERKFFDAEKSGDRKSFGTEGTKDRKPFKNSDKSSKTFGNKGGKTASSFSGYKGSKKTSGRNFK